MKNNQVFAYLIGVIPLVAAFYVYYELSFMGFPDGFLTELARGRRILFRLFIGVSIPVASWFIYLGWTASRKNIGKQLAIAVIGYTIFLVSMFIVDIYLRQTLTGGGGG